MTSAGIGTCSAFNGQQDTTIRSGQQISSRPMAGPPGPSPQKVNIPEDYLNTPQRTANATDRSSYSSHLVKFLNLKVQILNFEANHSYSKF